VKKLHEAVAAAKPGEWILAQGYDTTIIEGARTPTLAELDALAPDNPILIIEASVHIAYTNTLGYKAAEITRHTPNPPAARYMRDENGELNGQL
jgi:predicted amidohydrolase YtcJ